MMKRTMFFACALAGLAFSPAAASRNFIQVSDVWSRPATGTAVVYMTIANSSSVADRLVAASSPLGPIDLHESYEMSKPGMSGMNGMSGMSGMEGMKTVSAIVVPAHATVKLATGGYHLMLSLHRDLKAGDVIPLRLHFIRAGWVTTSARVRPME